MVDKGAERLPAYAQIHYRAKNMRRTSHIIPHCLDSPGKDDYYLFKSVLWMVFCTLDLLYSYPVVI